MPPKFSRGQAQSKEVELDGTMFRIGILEPMKALSLEHAMKGALLPALGSAMSGSSGGLSSLLDLEGKALGDMLRQLSDGLSEQLTLSVLDGLQAVSQAQDDNGDFYDLSNKIVSGYVFKGRPLLVYRFIWEGLKVNYSDFLEGFQSTDLQSLVAAAQVKSGSPSTSNGDG